MQKKWAIGMMRKLPITSAPIVMGILNVTPDSFSDDGIYMQRDSAVKHAENMLEEGAEIIDVGGESTRPGFADVAIEEEQKRVLPVVLGIKQKTSAIISVDTYHAETARKAIAHGAHIINDIWGLQKEPEIADIIASKRSGVVIMHNSRDREVMPDLIEDQKYFFDKSLSIAKKAGISESAIVLDPGFGFGKDGIDNIAIFKRVKELHQFGFPLLAATSRKRFLGAITGQDEAFARDSATAATSVILRQMGFSVFRVHNVAMNKHALAVADVLNPWRQEP